jgi:hypothetical protein
VIATRRQRIDFIARLGQAAKHATDRTRSGEQVRLSADLAMAADGFLDAAERLARLVKEELVALESARDWEAP